MSSNSKRPKNKGTSKQQQYRGKSRRDSEKARMSEDARSSTGRLSGLNDASWYTKNPLLVLPTASIPFPNRPGMTVSLGSFMRGNGPAIQPDLRIPGVCVLSWAPSIGRSESTTSPASIAAKEIYAKVRSAFSGALDADAPDFVIYMMCLDSVFSYIGALKRIYRCLDAYDANNFAMPEELIASMAITPSVANTLRTNKADFMLAINQLALASRKFAMPNVMDIFNRHYWLNDNVYTDDNTINSQFFLFRQDAFYKFALLDTLGDPATDGASGAQLVAAPWLTGASTVADFYNFGDSLIRALADSDDAYTMSGYLMRAYDGAPQFAVDQISGAEIFSPVYVPEVLMQIENAEPLSDAWPGDVVQAFGSSNNIWQNPADNSVWCQPALSNSVRPYASWTLEAPSHLINVRTDAPTPVDVIIASRLKAKVRNVRQSDGSYITNLWPASEVLMAMELLTSATSVVRLAATEYINLPPDATTASDVLPSLQKIAALGTLSYFDWHPFVRAIIDVAPQAGTTMSANATTVMFGDVHNITVMGDIDLENVNRVCLYSELNAFGEA